MNAFAKKPYLGLLCCAFVLFNSTVAGRAAAADPVAKPLPKATTPAAVSEPNNDGETPDAVTSHSVTVNGVPIAYTARAGTITVRNEQDQPTAHIFYTAYTTGSAATRPVTFIYNGGPGSSTMWLRMGSFGPVRVLAADGKPSGPAPYQIVDNPYSLIDKSDLVFIDMPDSGFGRILDPGKRKGFFGVDPDVAAFGQFMQRYLTQFGRWNSPKFIFGESYGTLRSAALADWLLNQGIALNGVILQSSILNYGLDYGNGDPIGGGDWPYVFYLPTEAATAWYHDKVRNKPANLTTFLHDVEHFGLNEYLDALSKGDRIGAAQRDDVVRKLSYYLGVSQQYIRNSNLRVPYSRFLKEVGRSQGMIYGRLDGRYQTYDLDRAAEQPDWDATDSSIDAPYTAAVNHYLRADLKYTSPLQYRQNIYGIIYSDGKSWDFSHNKQYPLNAAPDLADAMTQNPNLQVFAANGYYDFATPYFATVYTLKHLQLAAPLRGNITYGFYPAGHMIYLNDAALAQYKDDLAHWYDRAQGR
ncbi:MAG: peptidase S10 [Candidatus Eremiobacteraeota bacterium]|nr:peptidase S10 [Candidatus Eremiobacteraeota bacterium]